jgi:putative sigma-54 modulation protein
MEEHLRKGTEKIKKFFDGILDVQAILSVEKRAHRVEISILADGVNLHGVATTEDLYKSIDVALSRIQTQILKHKEKIQNHRLKKVPDGVEHPKFGVKVDVLSGEDINFGEKNPTIIRTRSYEMKPMSLDEAAMQMDLIQRTVLVFLDERSNQVNVLYRRDDGDYELFTPGV